MFLFNLDTQLDISRVHERIIGLRNEEKETQLRFRNVAVCETWLAELQIAVARSRVENPFQSVAPVRHDSVATWLVEGRTVFAAMAYAMMCAETSIFISGKVFFGLMLCESADRICFWGRQIGGWIPRWACFVQTVAPLWHWEIFWR